MRIFVLAYAMLAGLMAGPAAYADVPGKLAIELNDLQPADAGCRAVFVLRNGLGTALDKLTLRIVAFDGDAHATHFLLLDVGAMPAGKTRVLRFDLGAGSSCAKVSRLLLDEVTACSGTGVVLADCMAALSLSSRARLPLDY